MHTKITFLITIVCVNVVVAVSDSRIESNPYQHEATLDPKGKYKLTWLVDWDTKRVTFNVTVATNGYIGFGLSKKGKIAGADIIIGGVGRDGVPYFQDRYASSNQLPVLDTSQDYVLEDAWERGAQTFLSFSRPFDTCDADQDLPITDDVITVLWSYGENDDDLQYHFQNRGAYTVYLRDADLNPADISLIRSGKDAATQVFNLTTEISMNGEDYVYWCTYHKGPPTRTKQHVIGFNVVFPTERDKRHIHHLILYRCNAPPGIDPETLFEGATRSGGHECYLPIERDSIGARYCAESIYVGAVGSKAFFFPEHVGLPISEQGTDYYLLETHYNNPNRLSNLRVSVTLETYYTNRLREHDAGCLTMGLVPPAATSILVPPNSVSHISMGICASGCTEKWLDKEINVFAVLMHTHLAGRGVRALHFRGTQELPWITNDDNYDNNYQQIRILREERKVLPGDQLINRCVYETTSTNGSVVEGGYSITQEMCVALLYYYNKVPGFSVCVSEIKTEAYYDLLGIQNVTWDPSRKDMAVTSPSQFAGLTMQDYVDNHVEWDIQMREEVQKYHVWEPQAVICPSAYPEPIIEENDGLDDGERMLRYSGNGKISLVSKNTSRREPLQIVNENDVRGPDEHISALPQGVIRYKRPPQCTRSSG